MRQVLDRRVVTQGVRDAQAALERIFYGGPNYSERTTERKAAMSLTVGSIGYLGGDVTQPVLVIAVGEEGVRYEKLGPLENLQLAAEGDVYSYDDVQKNAAPAAGATDANA